MGRPEAPLDAREAPLREFAGRLRRLREESGGRSYRQLARQANFAAPTLARAASGRSLPSWEVTRAYVIACGGDPDLWYQAWASAARQAGRDRPGVPAPVPVRAAGGAAAGRPGPGVRQLPADLHDFVGRDTEYELLRHAVEAPAVTAAPGAPRVVVISGLGGVGKSTFAVHAAHRLADRFPDGQLFASLHGHDDKPTAPAQVAVRFLAALGVPADRSADPVGSFRSAASGRRLLVLLDNAADEAQVAPLLPPSSGCLVLVTSRQALGALARVQALCLDVFGYRESVELLRLAAGPGQVRPAAATAALVDLCGRLPLALRIAGARLAGGPAGSIEWLVDRLRDEDHRLRRLMTGDLDLSAVFALSYRPLTASQRRAFRYAGLFPGPDFAVAPLAVLAGMAPEDAETALDRLVDASLLQPARPGRYRMHDLLRLYALRCAGVEGDKAGHPAAIRRLALWYLAAVDAADRLAMPTRGRPAPLPGLVPAPGLPAAVAGLESAFAWYDTELPSLVAVTRAAARHGQHDVAWRLPAAMRGLAELRGNTVEGIATHQAGLESARALGDREAEGWMLNGLGNGYWRREAYPQAIECYRQALAIRTGLGDDRGVAVVLNNLGCVYGAQRRYGEAIDCLRQALAIREKLGNELDKSFALNSLGHLQHELGHCAEALPLLTEALRIRRELGSRNGEAATLHCLGDTLTGLGRHLEALACLRAALLTFRQLGNRYGEAAAQHSIGLAWRARGRPRYAERYLHRAIAIYRDLGRCTEEAAAREELAAAPAAASS
jgi:tetratricopeptide (TPR) repeat protein